jgi:hypothetical protein
MSLAKVARVESGLAVLQVGPDVTGARAFRRLGFTLVIGVAGTEANRRQDTAIQVLGKVQVDPVFIIYGSDLLIAPGPETRHAGRGAIAAYAPVQVASWCQ